MKQLGLRLNEKKCLYISKEPIQQDIIINQRPIERTSGDSPFKLLGVLFTISLNWDKQFQELKKRTLFLAYRIKNKCYSTKHKILLANTIIVPAINYSLNVVYLTKEQCKELDNTIANIVRKSANLVSNHTPVKLWDQPELGGAGLLSITHLNEITLATGLINQGLNHPNEFPRTCLLQTSSDLQISLTDGLAQKSLSPLINNLKRSLQIIDVKLQETNNANNPYQLNPLTYHNRELLWDKQEYCDFLPIWTDGSFNNKSNITTSACVIGKRMCKNKAWLSKRQGNSFYGELDAAEHAIHNIHSTEKTIIFIDCQSVIDLCNNPSPPTAHKDKISDPAISHKYRIAKTLNDINRRDLPKPEIIKVYSHIDEKLKNPETKESTKTHIKQSQAYLEERFGKETAELIINGNKAVDKLAGDLAAEPHPQPTSEPQAGMLPYYITEKGFIKEGNIRKTFKEAHQKIIHQERLKYSKTAHKNFDQFDLTASNNHLKSKHTSDSYFNHTLKLRNLGYYLPSRCSPNQGNSSKSKSDTNINNIKAQVLYPTPLCELCNRKEYCDLFHLHTCPSLAKEQASIKDKINKAIKRVTPNPISPFPQAARAFELQPPTNTITTNKCICELPEFGKYVKCTKCKNEFHPECLGVKISGKELEKNQDKIECRTCNPKNPLLFDLDQDWCRKKVHNSGKKKPKYPEETLITHALKLTTIKNRAKFRMHQENQGETYKAFLAREKLDSQPRVPILKRACLGYLPKTLVEFLYQQAKATKTPKQTVKNILTAINRALIEGSHTLYKAFLKKHRGIRKAEGVDLRKVSHKKRTPAKYTANIPGT